MAPPFEAQDRMWQVTLSLQSMAGEIILLEDRFRFWIHLFSVNDEDYTLSIDGLTDLCDILHVFFVSSSSDPTNLCPLHGSNVALACSHWLIDWLRLKGFIDKPYSINMGRWATSLLPCSGHRLEGSLKDECHFEGTGMFPSCYVPWQNLYNFKHTHLTSSLSTNIVQPAWYNLEEN